MNKKINSVFVILTFAFLFISKDAVSQRNNIQTIFYADSLTGFDEQTAKVKAMLDNCFGNEFIVFISKAKRNYIKEKYQLLTESASFKPAFSGNNQIMALCTNMDFEAGNLGGWTLTSGTNANSTNMAGCCGTPGGAATAVVPSVGNDPVSNAPLASPFGGGFICRINDVNVGAVVERISQTFTVTPANSLLQYAFMAVLESAGHTCAEQPYLNIRLLDCNNNIIPCPQAHISAPSGSCPSNDPGFQNGGGYSFHTAWQISALDLTPYVGSCITVQITVGDCTQSGHAGYAYFDAQCSPMNITVNGVPFPVGTNASTVSLCGAGTATITAPPNLGPYVWNGPAGSGVNNVTNQSFTTFTQGQYTLSMNPIGSCAPIIRLVNFSVSLPPTAGFNFTSTPCASSVNVVSTSSVSGGGPITGYQWVWGDGSPNTTANPAAHSYSVAGPQQIKLVISNASGCKDSITKSLTVTVPPIIDFTVNPSCLGLNTNFTNISTTGGAASINYTWTFGSGGVSTATNPSMTFATPGTFSVSLTGTNSDNCSNTIQKTYSVYPKPVINFTPIGFGILIMMP
ncbi:MAG: PKD domain-containing protein [Bacteroidetes bacterium]|nr:PKD domain-containing protein [Bacteroidota bacterium]